MQFLGNEFSIPDSVMGLTLLAIGMSVPEMVSSIAVARQGSKLVSNHLVWTLNKYSKIQ